MAALFNRALVNTRIGNDAAAMIDLNLAVTIDPKDADLYHNRALIHRRNVCRAVLPSQLTRGRA